jgi:tetratricopeptide (TPR) repeat protein
LYEAGGVSPDKRLALLEENHAIVKQRDDALSREIGLLVQSGDYDRAIELLHTHHFHVWEGGGRIHGVYVDAHLLKGLRAFGSGDFEKALQSFQRALEYPANLEVGKPVRGGKNPRIQYFIGMGFDGLGMKEKATEAYEKAVAQEGGWSELSFYQGMSCRELGREEEAIRIFSGLKAFARQKVESTADMDFFAKFGEKQSAAKRRAQAHYLLGLAHLGIGDRESAKGEFAKALELNINHLWAQRYLARF